MPIGRSACTPDGSRRASRREARADTIEACGCSASTTSRPPTAAACWRPRGPASWTIEHWHAHGGEPRPILDGVDAVVAYGGTMNPDEDGRLAWLADVRATLAEAVERDTAVLGICLGAQLLGQALGAGAPRLAQPELGWFPVELTPDGADDALLGRSRPSCEVFQWHDYGCELPQGAVALARSERAPQQAYRIGDAVWAIQFHIEVDADTVERWTSSVPELVRARGAEPADAGGARPRLRGRVPRDRARAHGPLPHRRAQPRDPPGWLAPGSRRHSARSASAHTAPRSRAPRRGPARRSCCCTGSAAPGTTGAGR